MRFSGLKKGIVHLSQAKGIGRLKEVLKRGFQGGKYFKEGYFLKARCG